MILNINTPSQNQDFNNIQMRSCLSHYEYLQAGIALLFFVAGSPLNTFII